MNRLSLNCDKTEVVWCATSRRQHQLPCQLTALWLSLWGPLAIQACTVYRCRPVDADPCPANGFAVFRRPPPAALDLSLSADRHVPDTGGQPCVNSFGLRQQCPGWPPGLLGPTTPVSAERGCAVDLSPAAIRPDLRRAGLPPLAAPLWENRY